MHDEWYRMRMEVLRILVEDLFTPYYIAYYRERKTAAAGNPNIGGVTKSELFREKHNKMDV